MNHRLLIVASTISVFTGIMLVAYIVAGLAGFL
jgi:phage shock protein PspC (stress-responsive transcriptional regulator)